MKISVSLLKFGKHDINKWRRHKNRVNVNNCCHFQTSPKNDYTEHLFRYTRSFNGITFDEVTFCQADRICTWAMVQNQSTHQRIIWPGERIEFLTAHRDFIQKLTQFSKRTFFKILLLLWGNSKLFNSCKIQH